MQRKTIVRLVTAIGLFAVSLVLAACASGVPQKDYDAVKAQVTAKDQELASAKQQITSLQVQLKPPAPREPKRLEATITIVMGETGKDQMYYGTAAGVKTDVFRVPAGKTVGIHIVNKGPDKEHEMMFGRTLKMEDGKAHGYKTNLFRELAADAFVYPAGRKVEVASEAELEEVELEPGADLWIRTTFPPELKGEWEIGCFIQELGDRMHYDQGMKAKLIVE